MTINKEIVNRGKWTQLGQLNKKLKISGLDITRKKIIFGIPNIFNVFFFFSIVLGSLQKTEFLLSDSVVIFCIIQYFFHIPLFFDFDHQKDF